MARDRDLKWADSVMEGSSLERYWVHHTFLERLGDQRLERCLDGHKL